MDGPGSDDLRPARLCSAADLRPQLALDRFYPQRIGLTGEQQGLDMSELGAGAYPELAQASRDYLSR